MPTRHRYPKSSLRIGSFKSLEDHIAAFAAGHLNFVVLLGPPGVGKSRAVREIIGPGGCWIDGTASTLGLYMEAYCYRDRPIVLDDVDGLYSDKRSVRLLKCLCQSEPVRSVSWLTNAPVLAQNDIPTKFQTSSPLLVIANRWKIGNEDVEALMDRGHILRFAPSPSVVHERIAGWFDDEEVFRFVGSHLHLMSDHSFRTYVLASEQRAAGLDWRRFVLSRTLTGTALEVALIRCDPQLKTEAERVQLFKEKGLGCRSTWFNYKRKWDQLPPAQNGDLVLTGPSTSESDSR
jgi:hypothetical protein